MGEFKASEKNVMASKSMFYWLGTVWNGAAHAISSLCVCLSPQERYSHWGTWDWECSAWLYSVTKIIYTVKQMEESYPQQTSEPPKEKSFMDTVPVYSISCTSQSIHVNAHKYQYVAWSSQGQYYTHVTNGWNNCHWFAALVIWVLPQRMIWHWYQYLLWFYVQKGKEITESCFAQV